MSNSSKDQTRQEEFKRATAGVLRAIAQQPEVQVAYQPGPSGLSGKRARLPLPTRSLPPAEMAKLRGAADAIALKLRHHDEGVHAARLPTRREAREVYDALEDVRVEVVGAQHMSGVAANLRARLADQCEAEGYDRMTRKDQLPLAVALGLLAREKLSGEPAPAAARRVLDLWRDTLGDQAEGALGEMATAAGDQDSYARAARKLLAALDLAEAEVETESEQDEEEGEGGESSPQQDQSGEGEARPRTPRACSAPSPNRCRATPPRTRPRKARRKEPRPTATTAPAARPSGARCRRSTTPPPTAPSARISTR
jgi:cobaltochelatase CobT